MRRWMDLFGDWIATKNGMLNTLLAMIETGEITHDQTRIELLAAITTILDAGRAADDLRRDVTAEDIASSLIGIFTVAPKPQREALATACWSSSWMDAASSPPVTATRLPAGRTRGPIGLRANSHRSQLGAQDSPCCDAHVLRGGAGPWRRPARE
ncbi:hypothetical protein WMF24_34820 [Sorangium sp. So ce1335]